MTAFNFQKEAFENCPNTHVQYKSASDPLQPSHFYYMKGRGWEIPKTQESLSLFPPHASQMSSGRGCSQNSIQGKTMQSREMDRGSNYQILAALIKLQEYLKGKKTLHLKKRGDRMCVVTFVQQACVGAMYQAVAEVIPALAQSLRSSAARPRGCRKMLP